MWMQEERYLFPDYWFKAISLKSVMHVIPIYITYLIPRLWSGSRNLINATSVPLGISIKLISELSYVENINS